MARVFFALWPPPAARAALAELAGSLAERCGGRAVRAEKLHLTLAFLGEVEARRAAAAAELAGDIDFAPFEVCFDRVGSFPRSEVAWAGMASAPAGLTELASRLAERLRAAQFALERRPFAPHLTLVRRIGSAVASEPIAPVAWTAESFALVESDLRSGDYRELGTWETGRETR